MLDLVIHVVAIAAVIGYVEYRLRSYAALMCRFDKASVEQLEGIVAMVEQFRLNSRNLSQQIDMSLHSQEAKLSNTLTSLVSEHESAIAEVQRSVIREMRDTVATSLKSFNDSVWRGVHSMAESIALPSYPTFTCYYCKQQFAVTQRERIGENDYCPEHGQKRKAMFPVSSPSPSPEVDTHDNNSRLHTADRGNKQSDYDKLPWVS
jgi:hypothetical protein